jgi:peptidoglycan/xylan/chitin deacetylase (PgdA/CDA1 family)
MRKRFLIATTLAAAWASPAPAPVASPIARALRLPRRVSIGDGVAVTFDDGPHPQGTPATLEALKEAGVSATFFLVGEQVNRNPSLSAEIVAAGHSIALHGYRHRNLLRLTPSQFVADLERGIVAITNSTGVQPTYYRPPYGIFSPAAIRIVRRRGLRPLLWSRWGHDWRARTTAEAIATEVSSGLCGGDVLLLHDADHYSAPGSWKRTVAALPHVFEAIEAAGLRAIAI